MQPTSIPKKALITYGALILVFLFLFLLSFQLSIFYPIYGDESDWKLISSRFLLDQKKLVYFFPACLNSFVLEAPISWYPGRLLDSLIYQGAHDHAQLRIVGIAQYIFLITIFWQIAYLRTNLGMLRSFLFVVAFLSIGVLPVLLIFNRPEQPLLMYLSLCIYLAVLNSHKPNRLLANQVFVTVVFCLLANLMIAAHPKGIYLLPIVLIAFRKLVKSPRYLLILLGVMCWTSVETIQLWNARTTCAASPWLETTLRAMTLNIGSLFSEPTAFLLQVIKNCVRFYSYLNEIFFHSTYQSQWLPSLELSTYKQFALRLLNALCWMVLTTIFVYLGLKLRKTKLAAGRMFESFAFAIVMCLALITVMQIGKNFYESALILPLLLLLCIFLINRQDGKGIKFITQIALPALLVVGALSSYTRYALWEDYLPPWRAAAIAPSINHDLVADFAKDQCGIGDQARKLILDSSTYTTFWHHPLPVFSGYLFGWYATGTDYKSTIAGLNPEGLVAMCDGLPAGLLSLSKKNGGMCCMSRSNLERLTQK